MNKKTLLCFAMLFSLVANSQRDSTSLSLKEECDLEHILYRCYALRHFGEDDDRGLRIGKPTEMVICFFDIDSSGKVANFSLLSDDKNKDSVFSILSRVTPLEFKDWQCEKCGGKTLMIPFIDFIEKNSKKPTYLQNYLSALPKTKETNNLVIVRSMLLSSLGEIERESNWGPPSVLPDSTTNKKVQPVKGIER